MSLSLMAVFKAGLFLCLTSLQLGCSGQKRSPVLNPVDSIPVAFPGAEGFGKYTTGGRGGVVLTVTNLNDSGPGSFRDAVQKNYPRIIVFAVSGTIHLQSRLNIKKNVTIAGQTAPGDGICLADHPVVLTGDNIIVRYLRFRMGDRYQRNAQVPGSGSDDAFSAIGRKNIIIDHCSMSWSTDEAFSVYAGDSTTLQWNMIYEPLNYSYHFEKGDTDFEEHGYGGIWGGRHTSAHHNLFAHCANRTPRFDGARNIPSELVDYRNNVIYNWGSNNIYAGEGGRYNLVNNYYKPGPSTKKNVRNRIANPYSKPPQLDYGQFYVVGNYVEGASEVSQNNWLGVHMHGGTTADSGKAKASHPFDALPVRTFTATEAFEQVLSSAGASYRRDTLDERIAEDVRNGTGRLIDVQGGFLHGTSYEQTITAWPALQPGKAPVDSDNDGMPDVWEKANGLKPDVASDAQEIKLHAFYTNIEVYINSIVK